MRHLNNTKSFILKFLLVSYGFEGEYIQYYYWDNFTIEDIL